MSNAKIPLNLIKVASPCTASWDAMSGDEQVRFCGQCAQYVYNLSEMTEHEAQTLITDTEGKMCVRFYRRSDGTMMTKDCPVGWRAIKRRIALVGSVAAAVFVAMFSLLTLGVFASVRGNGNGGIRFVNPIARVHGWLFPQAVMGEPMIVPPPGGGNDKVMVMGAMCPPEEIQQPPQQKIATPVEPVEAKKE